MFPVRVDKDFYFWARQVSEEEKKSVRALTQAIAQNGVFVRELINNQSARSAVEKIIKTK